MRMQQARTVCERLEKQECQDEGPCTILFEARTFLAIGTQIVQWIKGHPHYRIVSLSHAHEVTWEPGASLAGPEPAAKYTAILLVEKRAG